MYLWPECSRALVGFCAEARGTVPLKNVITQCSSYDPSRGYFESDEHLNSKHLNFVVFEPLAPRIIPTPNLQVFFFLCALPIVILIEKNPEKGSGVLMFLFPIFSIKRRQNRTPKKHQNFKKVLLSTASAEGEVVRGLPIRTRPLSTSRRFPAPGSANNTQRPIVRKYFSPVVQC